jgi:hypothetical protein
MVYGVQCMQYADGWQYWKCRLFGWIFIYTLAKWYFLVEIICMEWYHTTSVLTMITGGSNAQNKWCRITICYPNFRNCYTTPTSDLQFATQNYTQTNKKCEELLYKIIFLDRVVWKLQKSKNYKNLKNKPTAQNWCSLIKHVLMEFDLTPVWENQGAKHPLKFIKIFKRRVLNRYESNWRNYISSISSKLNLKPFSTFKTNFELENYIITNIYKRLNFTKLRVSARKLHSETGRHTKPKTSITSSFLFILS